MSFYCTADGKKRDLFVWHGAPALHTWRGDFGTSPHYYDLLPYDVFFFIPRVLRDRTEREGESSFYSQPQILADGFQSVIKRSFSSHHRERVQEGPIIHRPAYLFMRIIETLAHPVFSSSNLGLLLITIPAMFTAVSTTPFLYTRKALRTHCQTYIRTTFSFDVWMTGLSLSFFSQLFNQQNFHSLVPFFATMRSVECTGEISCAATKKNKTKKENKRLANRHLKRSTLAAIKQLQRPVIHVVTHVGISRLFFVEWRPPATGRACQTTRPPPPPHDDDVIIVE